MHAHGFLKILARVEQLDGVVFALPQLAFLAEADGLEGIIINAVEHRLFPDGGLLERLGAQRLERPAGFIQTRAGDLQRMLEELRKTLLWIAGFVALLTLALVAFPGASEAGSASAGAVVAPS